MSTRYRDSIAVVLLASCAAAAADDPPQVRARLVADSARPEPGGEVAVGVLFEMAPGWHIYWKNPGDSGLATDVRLELGDGFTAGDLRWPTPIRFIQPGDLTAYGYEGSVLLATEARAPRVLAATAATVAAEVSWLACREVCVLGSAKLEGRWPLPVADADFRRWRSGIPAEHPPFSVSTTGGIPPAARTGSLSVWLQWPEPPATIEFFPDPGDRLKVADVRVQTRGSLTRVDLAVTLLGAGTDRPVTLAAVVASLRPDEPQRSWTISVPVSTS